MPYVGNSKSITYFLQVCMLLCITQSYALITRSVGANGDYPTISSALVALSPFRDDVVLQVNTGFNGYGEPGGDYNSAVNFNGHSLDLLTAQPSGTEITYYVGSDVEYRTDVDGNLETVESVNGGAFSARRVYEGKGAASGTEYLVKNHLGSTVAMTDEEGHALGTYFEYAAYGTQDKIQSGPVARVTHTFTGKELDEGVDLYYFGARYYDPDLSMWISPDPMMQHASLYSYGGNNPMNRIDPDGNADYGSKEDYQKVGNTVVSRTDLQPEGKTTHCNQGLEAIANPGLQNPLSGRANDIVASLGDPKFATPISPSQATAYAEQGITPIAAWANPSKDKKGNPISGHVAAVAPGLDKNGRPMVFNVGTTNGTMSSGRIWCK